LAGPHSEGPVNPLRPLVATFSPVFHDPKDPLLPLDSRAKPIAVTCQSGALTFAFLSRGRDRQLRFTYQVSAGNQTIIEAHDYVDWVLDAGGADIFMCYLEGIRDTKRFRAVADKAARAGKPLIMAKVGRSDAGRRAAASHTGALARAGMADDAIFRHHGIIRGEDLDHMVDVASAFAYCPLPRGNRVAIITGSGGSAVWMADILSAHGLELPVLEDDIQAQIMKLLPSYGSAQNPIDATAQAIGELGYAKLVELVAQSKRIDTILLISSLANPERAKKLAGEMAELTASLDKPILLSTYTIATPASIAAIATAGIPCYTSMPSCARAIRALVDYSRFRERLARRNPVEATAPVVRHGYRTVLARAQKAHPSAQIDGVLVQAMARRGREIILGVTRDLDFGPMLMVGLGGIHVEVLKDVAFAPVPLGTEEALDLIGELKGAVLHEAVRGEPAADRNALAVLLVALSRFAADHADAIAEIDLNPVIVHPAGEGL